MESHLSLYSPHALENREEVDFRFNALHLRIVRDDQDLLLFEWRESAHGKNPGKHHESEEEEEEPGYRRYAFEKAVKRIQILPRTPARPLVVRPRQPLFLVPGSRVVFYVRFPLDLEIKAMVGSDEHILERIQSDILSDTWFGDPMSGIFGYALKSRARRSPPGDEDRVPGIAVCRIGIHNDSAETFKCEKFCLRLEHCRLWHRKNEVWTSPLHIRYRGPDYLSSIDYRDIPPDNLPGAELISEAVEVPTRNLVSRTFSFTGLIGTP